MPERIPKRTSENIEKLVHSVLDSWDMDTLISYAHDRLEESYQSDDELFLQDWRIMSWMDDKFDPDEDRE